MAFLSARLADESVVLEVEAQKFFKSALRWPPSRKAHLAGLKTR
jgi:hypothetical protein